MHDPCSDSSCFILEPCTIHLPIAQLNLTCMPQNNYLPLLIASGLFIKKKKKITLDDLQINAYN